MDDWKKLHDALDHLWAGFLRDFASVYRRLRFHKTADGFLAWADRLDPAQRDGQEAR